MADEQEIRKPRHKWDRFKEHHYFCVQCACLKVNVEVNATYYEAHYYMPDGTSAVRRLTPPCAPGAETEKRLARWAAIKANPLEHVDADGAPPV